MWTFDPLRPQVRKITGLRMLRKDDIPVALAALNEEVKRAFAHLCTHICFPSASQLRFLGKRCHKDVG
jgi:hypothetical protein